MTTQATYTDAEKYNIIINFCAALEQKKGSLTISELQVLIALYSHAYDLSANLQVPRGDRVEMGNRIDVLTKTLLHEVGAKYATMGFHNPPRPFDVSRLRLEAITIPILDDAPSTIKQKFDELRICLENKQRKPWTKPDGMQHITRKEKQREMNAKQANAIALDYYQKHKMAVKLHSRADDLRKAGKKRRAAVVSTASKAVTKTSNAWDKVQKVAKNAKETLRGKRSRKGSEGTSTTGTNSPRSSNLSSSSGSSTKSHKTNKR